jgi:hypothetical protein
VERGIFQAPNPVAIGFTTGFAARRPHCKEFKVLIINRASLECITASVFSTAHHGLMPGGKLPALARKGIVAKKVEVILEQRVNFRNRGAAHAGSVARRSGRAAAGRSGEIGIAFPGIVNVKPLA